MPIERAKQFLPFDALKGLREALREKEKIIVIPFTLSEDMENEINQTLINLKISDIVEVTHFSNHEYIVTTGIVSKKKNDYFTIVKQDIYYKDILKIKNID